jgi:hypothetical protein
MHYHCIMQTGSIIFFSILILLVFSFISLLSIPWLFASQHQAVAFLGIFLIFFTIPPMLFIFFKKQLKIIYITYYLIYFIPTSYTNFILSAFLQKTYFYKFHFTFEFSQLFDLTILFFCVIFFSLQFPIMILCIILKQIKNYDKTVNMQYFLKNPLIYVFICSLFLFPLTFH